MMDVLALPFRSNADPVDEIPRPARKYKINVPFTFAYYPQENGTLSPAAMWHASRRTCDGQDSRHPGLWR